MDYHILKKYRYTNRNQFESIYSSRYKNELVLHYDFEIHGFPCFSLPTTEILNLTSRIYKLTQTLIYLKSKLPQIALEQYTQTCLVDEVKLTNEIEGVNSTRREIQDILNTQSITKKNMRLYGLVQKYNLLKTMLEYDIEDKNNVLFIDEIQESGELISSLKYFCEEHNNVNIVCAGSLLGLKIKRSKNSFPVGKVWMLDMYPMSFEEFLIANNKEKYVDLLKTYYEKNKSLGSPMHEELLKYYRAYLLTGGMPEAIQNLIDVNFDYFNYDTKILKDIVSAYYKDMKKYVTSEQETLKIERVYNSLPSQLLNNSKKFQFSKVETDGRKDRYETATDWLLASNLIVKCNNVTLPEIPLKAFTDDETFKYYLSDVGILCSQINLNTKDIVNDNISLFKGAIAENYVANQLLINGFELYYWKSTATAEVDFLLYTNDGVIPVEVKASDNTQSKSLKLYMEKYKPKYAIRISTKDFGYNPETKIKSIPLYAVFLINDGFKQTE